MIGVLSPDEIDQLLRRHTVGRLVCASHDQPHIVPITYAEHGVAVYAYSGPGRKVEIMREQPRGCFEVDEVGGPNEWRSAVVGGTFEEFVKDKARREALSLLGMPNDAAGRALKPNCRGIPGFA